MFEVNGEKGTSEGTQINKDIEKGIEKGTAMEQKGVQGGRAFLMAWPPYIECK